MSRFAVVVYSYWMKKTEQLMLDIEIKEAAISMQECLGFVKDAGAGGSAVFVGPVRNQTNSKRVVRLDFNRTSP